MKRSLWIIVLTCLVNVIQAQTSFTATISYTPASCPTCCDGSAVVILSGGAICSPYFVTWSNGATTMQANNICPGPISATVTTGNPSNCPTQICSTTMTYSIPTGIMEISKPTSRFNVVNPANDCLDVNYQTVRSDAWMELMDVQGRILESYRLDDSAHRILIPTQQIANGMYILRLREVNRIVEWHKVLICHP